MENPLSWSPVTKEIQTAIEWHEMQHWDEPDLCGPSLAQFITDRLRQAGFLRESPETGQTIYGELENPARVMST